MPRAKPPPGGGKREPILRRIERAAQDLNPFLVLIVIGLGILDCSVFMALELRPAPHSVSSSQAATHRDQVKAVFGAQ